MNKPIKKDYERVIKIYHDVVFDDKKYIEDLEKYITDLENMRDALKNECSALKEVLDKACARLEDLDYALYQTDREGSYLKKKEWNKLLLNSAVARGK